MSVPQRPPFDDEDAAIAQRYLRSRDLTAFDPFAVDSAGDDVIFTTSLAVARRMMEESFATSTAGGRRFRVYPLFVDRSSPNAFAIDCEGVQVCGIHVGLVVSLFEISLFVFSQATLFPEIGDPSVERSPSLPKGAALSFLMSDRLRADPAGNGEAIGAEFLPQDGQRQLAAHFLTQLMMRFAWLHELYHGLNGHSGLKAARHHGTALDEMPNESMPMVDIEQGDIDLQWKLTLHCMEFDADRAALWAMMRMQEDDAEPVIGLAVLAKTTRRKLVLFAGIMMTFLFDQSAARREGATTGTHPLAYHRLHNLVRTLASNLSDPSGSTTALFDDVLSEMTRLKERVPQLFSPPQLLHDLRAADLQEAFDRVEEALQTARAQFAPFAFRHAPAPGETPNAMG